MIHFCPICARPNCRSHLSGDKKLQLARALILRNGARAYQEAARLVGTQHADRFLRDHLVQSSRRSPDDPSIAEEIAAARIAAGYPA